MNAPTQTSVAQFFNWLRGTFPQVYNGLKTSGLPLAAIDFGSILDNVTKTAQAYLQYDAQKDLVKLQLERARQGLAPIDTSQYAPGVNVGLSSDTQSAMTKWLLIGGAVLIAVMFLRR